MKVTVFGAGYVGMSLAAILCVKNETVLVDIDPVKVSSVNNGRYPVSHDAICEYLKDKKYNLHATLDPSECRGSDYILIATPTNYDPDSKYFDTSSIDSVVDLVNNLSPESILVIRSTVPIGYTEILNSRYPGLTILFSPEFLREGNAIWDSLNPSRIVIGSSSAAKAASAAEGFARLMGDSIMEDRCEILHTGTTEAESIKLFSNSYLAMRVAFFNELDSYAEFKKLNSEQIIRGVCLDPRIGDYYNNPSFGYGGYCLPKDTKQLLSDYEEIPNALIGAIVDSNRVRKEFIAEQIIRQLGCRKTVGIYRLIMKAGSDNFRESSVLEIIRLLKEKGKKVLIYEPLLKETTLDAELIPNLEDFISVSDLIVANRIDEAILPYRDKVYCRDLFHRE